MGATLLRDAEFLELEREAESARDDYKMAKEALRIHKEGHENSKVAHSRNSGSGVLVGIWMIQNLQIVLRLNIAPLFDSLVIGTKYAPTPDSTAGQIVPKRIIVAID